MVCLAMGRSRRFPVSPGGSISPRWINAELPKERMKVEKSAVGKARSLPGSGRAAFRDGASAPGAGASPEGTSAAGPDWASPLSEKDRRSVTVKPGFCSESDIREGYAAERRLSTPCSDLGL